ncbi:MAG: type IV secretory system conjugative DNA transfer family protein, partial [Bacteroidetes bacterium]|nr:type IV secretory system conjugative DNA transfer family protein [Bacteroidota bacterium]
MFKSLKPFLEDIWEVIKIIWEDLTDAPPKPIGSPHKAKFVSSRKILRNSHYGFCLTGTKRLSVANSFKHAIIYGSSGTGKSSTVLLPSLYTTGGSLVIHDP